MTDQKLKVPKKIKISVNKKNFQEIQIVNNIKIKSPQINF
jgi:hypothetical protein